LGTNSSIVTQQGNAFNGPNQLIETTGGGYYPALNGSLITGINGSVAGGVAGQATYWTGAVNISPYAYENYYSSGVVFSTNVVFNSTGVTTFNSSTTFNAPATFAGPVTINSAVTLAGSEIGGWSEVGFSSGNLHGGFSFPTVSSGSYSLMVRVWVSSGTSGASADIFGCRFNNDSATRYSHIISGQSWAVGAVNGGGVAQTYITMMYSPGTAEKAGDTYRGFLSFDHELSSGAAVDFSTQQGWSYNYPSNFGVNGQGSGRYSDPSGALTSVSCFTTNAGFGATYYAWLYRRRMYAGGGPMMGL
jgi:hypothetical protein